MFKGINWNKVMVIMAVSFALLITGWLLYINYAIKGPLEEAVSSIEGVNVNDISIMGNELNLEITLDNIDNFQQTYTEILDKTNPYLNNKKLNIAFTNKGSQELITVWNQSYFYIAEAIEQKKYSLIPEKMEEIEEKSNLDKIGYGIDEQYLYFDLHKDSSSLYVVIPRSSKQGGE